LTPPWRAGLIGGSSHLGKSTIAAAVAAMVGGEARSTDRMGPHPGRPWPVGETAPPPHTVAHYQTLSGEELIVSVVAHYRHTIWPLVRDLVRRRSADEASPPLVLEGSALLPDLVAGLVSPAVRAVWLVAEDGLIGARIRRESRYETRDAAGRTLIDTFIARSLSFDALVRDQAGRLGLPTLEIGAATSEDAAAAAVMRLLAG
jgi:2-phosphoglycerate kinase